MTRSVVALIGNRPRCGKTTVANILIAEYGYIKIGVADPIRKMMATFGLSEDEISGSLKDEPNDKLLGVTPRRMMQTIGRGVPLALGRPEYWAELWYHTAEDVAEVMGHRNIVVDDHRYLVEKKWFQRFAGNQGARVYRVHREGGAVYDGATHAAETQALDGDAWIMNAGDLDMLKRTVRARMDLAGRMAS
jgi:hypothetical protein